MYEWVVNVYALINEVNGKAYVGCTTRPIDQRLQEHMNLLKRKKHTSSALQADYDKGHTFRIVLLESGKTSYGNFTERLWMVRLKTYDERYGYNSQDPATYRMRRKAGLPIPPSKLKGKPSPLKGKKYQCSFAPFPLNPYEIAFRKELENIAKE